MFETLNLEGVTTTTQVTWGRSVAQDRLSFRCGCSVQGYQHAGLYLVTDGRPCYKHGPDGREPIDARLPVPLPGATSQGEAWFEGFSMGYRRGRRWPAPVTSPAPFPGPALAFHAALSEHLEEQSTGLRRPYTGRE